MRIKHFKYEKPEGIEERQVLVLHEDKDYVEGISITKFQPKEVLQLFEIQRNYEAQIKAFIEKGYRKFRKDKIKEILGESNESAEKQA